jgi:2-oxoglutarate dehydrogenase E2 component (dihydrolipoamide succinyltransferase)
MISELKIPSPGESITEALLAKWFIADGDTVSKDQEIGEVESDKATLPLIAPESGQIKLRAMAGDTVKIGSVAATIDTSVAVEAKAPAEKTTTDISFQAPIATISATKEDDSSSQIKISPIAQKMMDENKLTVQDVVDGLKRIGKQEIEAVLHLRNQPQTEKKHAPRTEERATLSPLRKKLSERLVAVKNQTAMLTTFNEIDMMAVMELRKKYQSQFETKHGIKLGFMSFFAKAVSLTLKLHPNVNSMLDGDEIISPSYTDIAIAVQTDKGLMVPVLRDVENLSLAEIEKGIADMAAKARANRLSIGEMAGGTFTITNGGVFGSLLSTPIINPPQSAILGMHNIVERPVAINGKVEIRPMMYVALSYDHRIIDGKDSVGFLVHVKQFIENPVKLLFADGNPEKALFEL